MEFVRGVKINDKKGIEELGLKPLECADIIIECIGHMFFKTAVSQNTNCLKSEWFILGFSLKITVLVLIFLTPTAHSCRPSSWKHLRQKSS